jgi:hypothetical protein
MGCKLDPLLSRSGLRPRSSESRRDAAPTREHRSHAGRRPEVAPYKCERALMCEPHLPRIMPP